MTNYPKYNKPNNINNNNNNNNNNNTNKIYLKKKIIISKTNLM